ncbi:MAG: transcription elongation factor Spt5 [archaeon]
MIEELEKEEKKDAEKMKDILKEAAPGISIKIKGAMTKEEVQERDEATDKEVAEDKEAFEAKMDDTPKEKEEPKEEGPETLIFAVRTTANREDQVMDFIASNADRKKLEVFTVIRPHGMRGYIFVEAADRSSAEQAAYGIPYARGLLPNVVGYEEIEHMLEQVKKEINIQKNDIAEIISGPFKREKCKITRVDKQKGEVVVELLEAAVPIPITVKIDSVKVIRRDDKEE